MKLIPIKDNKHYYADRSGNIYSTLSGGTVKLKPTPNNRGYLRINLRENKQRKLYSVHRLVGFTYLDNPENKPCINHKNGVKVDNEVDNLEWCTYSENNKHAFSTGLNKVSQRQRDLTRDRCRKPVKGICMNTGDIVKFSSGREAERHGFIQSSISSCVSGKQKTHKGYSWEYV